MAKPIVTRHPVAQALSAEDLEQFAADLRAMPGGPTLANIQRLAKERAQLDLSDNSASTLKALCARVSERSQRAAAIAEALRERNTDLRPGEVADAAADEVSQQLYLALMDSDGMGIDLADDASVARMKALTETIAKLRTGDHAMRALNAKLEATQAQAKALLTDTAMSEAERAQRMRELFGLQS